VTVSQATQEGITLLKETREEASDTKADTDTREHTKSTHTEHTNPPNNDSCITGI